MAKNDALVFSAGGRLCAIPIANVVEIMRPLPVLPVAGANDFLEGLSMIRGMAIPVVRLGALLGQAHSSEASRYIVIRVSERRICLHVASVLGVRPLDDTHLQQLPPLLKDADQGAVTAISEMDHEFLMVLDTAKLLPPAETA